MKVIQQIQYIIYYIYELFFTAYKISRNEYETTLTIDNRQYENSSPKITESQLYTNDINQEEYEQQLEKLNKIKDNTNRPYGLNNQGNTCYMDSALQVLLASRYLRKYILNSPCNGQLFTDMKNLYNLQNKNIDSYTPYEFKLHFGKIHREFQGYAQQDSSEMIALLLDDLENEEKKYYQEKNGRISKFLSTTIKRTITCDSCNYESSNYENNVILNLDVQQYVGQGFLNRTKYNQYLTLQECLDAYLQSEKVTIKCEKCQTEGEFTMSKQLNNLPEQIFITFKRFNYSRQKAGHSIAYDKILQIKDKKYQLDAVSLHSGFVGGGHYTAYSIVNDEGYYCNDSWVKNNKIDYSDSGAYVLSYSLIQ